jgi:hypothetical protein
MARKEPEPFDPYELGTRRNDPTLAALEPLPPDPRKTKLRNLLLGFLGVVVLIAVASHGRRGVPDIGASCTKPSFALEATSVPKDGLLGWSAVGPADGAVVFAADSQSLPTSVATGRLSGPSKLLQCAAHGRFGVPLPVGPHTITVFVVNPSGGATVLGSQKITVT